MCKKYQVLVTELRKFTLCYANSFYYSVYVQVVGKIVKTNTNKSAQSRDCVTYIALNKYYIHREQEIMSNLANRNFLVGYTVQYSAYYPVLCMLL